MRIIGGSARGRRLFSPQTQSKSIRPTTDRAREALFSIIGRRISDARVLDLFAGSGAFGCEALSRDAARVVFIDNSRAALELIKKNINLVESGQQRAAIYKIDLCRGLNKVHRLLSDHRRFDIIFADPPYLSGLSDKILLALDKSPLLAQNPLVVIEEQKSSEPSGKLEHLYLSDIRTYGESSFFFYSERNK
jgi:16S rRNA (guanine966-N2)-methyltransferase